jgi:hypothetical protein
MNRDATKGVRFNYEEDKMAMYTITLALDGQRRPPKEVEAVWKKWRNSFNQWVSNIRLDY